MAPRPDDIHTLSLAYMEFLETYDLRMRVAKTADSVAKRNEAAAQAIVAYRRAMEAKDALHRAGVSIHRHPIPPEG